jgi:hypothetical protein
MWKREVFRSLAGIGLIVSLSPLAAQEATVSGKLIANGAAIELPYVYAYAKAEGFYDPGDPTWLIMFSGGPIEVRELESIFTDFPYVRIGITRTSEFDDEPKLQAYSQDIKKTADGANVSGGTYPEVTLTTAGPDRLAGRVVLTEGKLFDDTFQYDFTFDVPLSDPNGPIGEMLPADGGEPGKAYLAWVEAVHSGSLEALKKIVPPEMAEMLDADDAGEQLEFLRTMTPTDVKLLSGSSDGSTAILDVEGVLEGEKVSLEITMSKMGEHWVATNQKM